MKFNLIKRLVLQCTMGLFLTAPHYSALSDSPVWKIQKGNRHLYIGGTIHFLGAMDYPLPAKLDFAYNRSDLLVFETDMQAVTSQQFQQEMLRELTYQDGKSLKDDLLPETLSKLSDYCATKQISLEQIVTYKAGLASLVLTIAELQRLGMGGVGVDQYYYQRATADKRATDYLESTRQQLQFLKEMGGDQADATINYALQDLSELAKTIGSIKSAWRVGDLQKIENVSLTPLANSFPEVYHSLLVERNANWMADLEQMLDDERIELVLVGALHLVGEAGLLQQLRARGYIIENL